MERNDLIEMTLLKMQQMPNEKLREMNDFAEFLLMKIDDQILRQGIQELTSNSKAFGYLNDDDDDLYSVNDLKEKYK